MTKKERYLVTLLIALGILIVTYGAFQVGRLTSDSGIDINNATFYELTSLPGIGKILAERIIENRPYDDIYELTELSGFGYQTVYELEKGGLIDIDCTNDSSSY